jgi:hypothetical protein
MATNAEQNVEDSTVFCCLEYNIIGVVMTNIKIPVYAHHVSVPTVHTGFPATPFVSSP